MSIFGPSSGTQKLWMTSTDVRSRSIGVSTGDVQLVRGLRAPVAETPTTTDARPPRSASAGATPAPLISAIVPSVSTNTTAEDERRRRGPRDLEPTVALERRRHSADRARPVPARSAYTARLRHDEMRAAMTPTTAAPALILAVVFVLTLGTMAEIKRRGGRARDADRGGRASVVVGVRLRGHEDRERAAHPRSTRRSISTSHRRRHPQLLGPRARSEDGHASWDDKSPPALRPPRPVPTTGSAPSSAVSSTRGCASAWSCSRRSSSIAGSARRLCPPLRRAAMESASFSRNICVNCHTIRGTTATGTAGTGPDAHRSACDDRCRRPAE